MSRIDPQEIHDRLATALRPVMDNLDDWQLRNLVEDETLRRVRAVAEQLLEEQARELAA